MVVGRWSQCGGLGVPDKFGGSWDIESAMGLQDGVGGCADCLCFVESRRGGEGNEQKKTDHVW